VIGDLRRGGKRRGGGVFWGSGCNCRLGFSSERIRGVEVGRHLVSHMQAFSPKVL
jgi:hypothetical protein